MHDEYEDCGIVYVATGQRYLSEAIISARSAKRAMPDVPITIFTDLTTDEPSFNTVTPIAAPQYGFKDKLLGILRTPYARTMYLDSDTYVCGDIRECFSLLRRFDLLCAHDALRINMDSVALPRAFPEFNCGMIWYDRDKCSAFIKAWELAYAATCDKHGRQVTDQPDFRITLYESDLSFYVLPPEYHCMIWEAAYVQGSVKVLHGRNDIPLEQLAAHVNAAMGPRIFKAGLGVQQVAYKSDICRWAFRVVRSHIFQCVSSIAKAVQKSARRDLAIL